MLHAELPSHLLVLLIVRALSGLYPFRLDVQGVERTISTAILS
jgi:hypothetical protein